MTDETNKTRVGFYGQKQIYLFMVWQEDWYDGEVIYARVLFRFLNIFAIKERYRGYLKWANSKYAHPFFVGRSK